MPTFVSVVVVVAVVSLLLPLVASTEIVQPVQSAGDYASPSLGVGPSKFELAGFVSYLDVPDDDDEHVACDRTNGRDHSMLLGGTIAMVRASYQCTAQRMAEFAQDAGAIGAIVVDTDTPGSRSFERGEYDVRIPAVQMSESDWDEIGWPDAGVAPNSTFAVLRPTDNPWTGVKSREHWAAFSALFGSIAVLELLVCTYRLWGYFSVYGERKYSLVRCIPFCGVRWHIPYYAVRWQLPEIVLAMELLSLILRIAFLVDPGAVFGVYSSSISVSLLTVSFPPGIATNLLVGMYWLNLLRNDFRPPSKKGTMALGRWKWPCIVTILFVFALEVFNNTIADVYREATTISGPFSGALYMILYGASSPFFFYANWRMYSHVKGMMTRNPKTEAFVRKLGRLMAVSGFGSVLVFAAPLSVSLGLLGHPDGMVFTYWSMFTGLSALSGSQISMFSVDREARFDNTKTTLTKSEDIVAEKRKASEDSRSEDDASSSSHDSSGESNDGAGISSSSE